MTRLDRGPLRFDPSDERLVAGEDKVNAAISRSMRGILETTWRDYGHSVRSVHAKSHALLVGELEVLDGLPAELAQGLFATPAAYPVVMRFSTNPGDILDDTVSAPRGLAIKIIGVEGERLAGSENDSTQDFVLVNGPAFVAPDAAAFAKSLKLLAATTNTGQAWKKLFSASLRGIVSLRTALGLESGSLKGLGGQPMTHPLGETFYTQSAFRYGDHVAKISVAPASSSLTALHDQPVPLAGKPNGLRGALIEYFARNGGIWDLRVQLRTNARTMPVEDASVPWPETESPYRTVARLTVEPQPAWSEARARQADDGLSFSPWHGIAAHKPLGSINRARREVYAMSAAFRAEHNGCPMREPGERLMLSAESASVYGRTPGREGRRPNTPDARPGSWTQPMVMPLRQAMSGAIAGLAGGLLLSAIMLGMEAATGEPNELVRLQRRSIARLARGRDEGTPSGAGEQVTSHGGHLALSAGAGALYGLTRPVSTSPWVGGAGFGTGFYALAYGLLGPALGVTPPLWKDKLASIAQHGGFHLVFGLVTALLTPRIENRL